MAKKPPTTPVDIFAEFIDPIAKAEAQLEQVRLSAVTGLKEKRAEIESKKRELTADLDRQLSEIDKRLVNLGVGVRRGGESSAGGGRKRRTTEDLKADAQRIVDYLKAQPNSTSSSITEVTGVDYGQDLALFVEKHLGVKIKKNGSKRSMTYSV